MKRNAFYMTMLVLSLTIIILFISCKKGIGDLKWSVELGGTITAAPAVSSDGTIYVGCTDNKLYAVSSDGDIKWTFEAGHQMFAPSIGSDGTIYIGSVDDNLYAVNPDGSQKWSVDLGGNATCPAIGGDGTIYVRSNYGENICAINPDGTKKWDIRIAISGVTNPVIGIDGTIYAGGFGVILSALEPDSGIIKWTTGGGNGSNCAIGANGNLYVVTWSIMPPYDEFYELEPDSGTIIRSFGFGLTAPIVGNNSIYIWGEGNTLFDIPVNGSTANGIFTNPSGNLYPPAILSSGNLCFGAGDTFYVITPSGEVKYALYTEENVSTPPVIGLDGSIYFGAGKKLYAMIGEESYPSNLPWPMYQCDHYHSGRAK